jgi:hypothetical protein
MVKYNIGLMGGSVSWRVIFDKRSCWLLAKAKTCDPLPTGYPERENRAEFGQDWTAEKR